MYFIFRYKLFIIFTITTLVPLSNQPFFVEILHNLALLSDFNQQNRTALYNFLKDSITTDGNSDSSGMNLFLKPEEKPLQKQYSFEDIAGTVPQDIIEIIDFIKDPIRFARVGARMPKGILLYGPPGTGKTSLARAIAGESGAQFIHASGSEFVEVYVGVGPQRVRELFDKAKKHEKSIIFIDEIDAIGGKRSGDSNSEYRNTLNELLNQMDGFSQNNITVIAATNNVHMLDKALLRPGRFDRLIKIGLPDTESRFQIFKHYSKKIAYKGDIITLINLSKATEGLTGADIKNIINEAAILAARNNKDFVDEQNLKDACKKILNQQDL